MVKRVLKWTLRLLTGSLCVAAAVFWVRSYRTADLLGVLSPRTGIQVLGSHRGGVVFVHANLNFDPSLRLDVEPVTAPAEEFDSIRQMFLDDMAKQKVAFAGFRLARGDIQLIVTNPPPVYTAVGVPHAFVMLITGVPTILWLRGVLRRRRWVRQGRCRGCGYDLRSSPDRCPECGDVPKSAPAVPAAALATVFAVVLLGAPDARAGDWRDRVVPELDLADATFGQAMDKIAALTGRNFVVRWPALQGAGVTRETPVRLVVREVQLSTALDVVLRLLGIDIVPLGWEEIDGVITVSTAEDLGRGLKPKVYDVRDILTAVRASYAGAPFEEGRTAQEAMDEILRLVTETIEPDSWRDAGGSVGSVRELGGRLIITQSPRNLREVEWLLNELRSEFGKPPTTTRPATTRAPPPRRDARVTRFYPVGDVLSAIDTSDARQSIMWSNAGDALIRAIVGGVRAEDWVILNNNTAGNCCDCRTSHCYAVAGSARAGGAVSGATADRTA